MNNSTLNYNVLDNSVYHEIRPEYGYLVTECPQVIKDNFTKEINKIQKDFSSAERYNLSLAGEIEHEYYLDINVNDKIREYLKEVIQAFENKCKYFLSFPTSVKMDDSISPAWVNFQRKHEHNPVHNHSGMYSWIYFHQIPYTLEEEQNFRKYNNNGYVDPRTPNDPNKPAISSNGRLEFLSYQFLSPYHNPRISSFPLPADKNTEGFFLMFPSDLHHVVYPFYSSDDYRITVAGNITGIL